MKTIISIMLLFSSVTYADYKLAKNGRPIICYADDNQSWEINKSRTTIKFTVEGESLGAKKIFNRVTDHHSFISYTTVEGTLTLDKKTDTFKFDGNEESFEIDCK